MSATPGHSVELRVLVLTSGGDAALAVIEPVLANIGVDYEVVDVSRTEVTAGLLRSGDVGRFNGIILTDGRLGGNLSTAEWSAVHAYQRDFDVRQAIMSGPPAPQGSAGPGVRLAGTAAAGDRPWFTAAAAPLFPYLNTATGPTIGVASPTTVAAGGADPRVTPLMHSAAGGILVARLDYADGRETLYSSLNHAVTSVSSQVLAYAFVHFSTRGLHLGSPRMYLSAHVDDTFHASDMWGIGTGGIGPEDFRLSASDWRASVAAQRQLAARFPTASGFRVEHAFNGVRAATTPGVDPLTDAIVAGRHEFFWLNHTFTHRNLDASNGWSREVVENEILANNAVWSALGLPGVDSPAQRGLITGEHSGLSDGAVPYPNGLNPVLVAALMNTGIRYVGGDTSRPNQSRPGFVPGTGDTVVFVPRWPTNVFYNANTPARLTDAYNTVYRRNVTYGGLRATSAAEAFAHITSFANYPHYFHQANLHAYDGTNSLLFDWLTDTVALYDTYFRLPLVTMPFHRIGEITEARLRRSTAGVRAQLAIATGEVTIRTSNHAATVEVTGLVGPLHGPVPVRDVLVAGEVAFAAAGYAPPSGFPRPPGSVPPVTDDRPAPVPTPTPTPTPSPMPTTPPVSDDTPTPPTVPGDSASPTPTPVPDDPDDPPVVRCKGRVATIVGTAGDDTLVGTARADVIVALGGRDRIRARGGNDVICAGGGNDIVVAGAGNDVVVGAGGSDRLVGGPGRDRIAGGAGRDRIAGGSGSDQCRGGGGRDRVRTCER